MQPSIPWSSVFVFVTERQPCILWILLCRFHSSHHLLSLAVTHCHLFPLVVTHCTTSCHSLYHSLSSIVTHVIRCTTRLSFYKRSFGGCSHLKKLFSFWERKSKFLFGFLLNCWTKNSFKEILRNIFTEASF